MHDLARLVECFGKALQLLLLSLLQSARISPCPVTQTPVCLYWQVQMGFRTHHGLISVWRDALVYRYITTLFPRTAWLFMTPRPCQLGHIPRQDLGPCTLGLSLIICLLLHGMLRLLSWYNMLGHCGVWYYEFDTASCSWQM